MGVLDKVLALRPTNAVARMGPSSRAAVLNPRDLSRALAENGAGALVSISAATTSAVGGLLRAARDADAPLGLCCRHPFAERDAPRRFFDAVRRAADELDHQRPIFLEAGPIALPSADAGALEKVAASVFELVDAGFGLISLDASGLEADEAAEAYRQVAHAALERELSIEVAVPLREGRPHAEGLRELAAALERSDLRPRYLRVDSAAVAVEMTAPAEWAVDSPVVEGLARAAQGLGAELCLEERGPLGARWADAWLGAGARKIRGRDTFDRVVGKGAQEPDALAALDARAEERIEALWYGEAMDLFAKAAAEGTASRAMVFLAQRAGY